MFLKHIKLIHFYYIFIASVTIGISLFLLFSDHSKREYLASDFIPYYLAGSMARNGDIKQLYLIESQISYFKQFAQDVSETPYFAPPQSQFSFLPFLNFPLIATAFIPSTFLPVFTAFRVFLIINMLLLLLTVFLFREKLGLSARNFIWILAFEPIFNALMISNISFFVLLVLTLLAISLTKNDALKTGFLTGMLILKPQYLLIGVLIFLFIKTRIRFAAGVALFIVPYVLVNFIIYGTALFGDLFGYYKFILSGFHPVGVYFNIYSLTNVLNIEFVRVIHTVLLLLAALFILLQRNKHPPLKLFMSALMFSIILNFHNMYTDTVFLLIPLVYFLAEKKSVLKYSGMALIFFTPFAANVLHFGNIYYFLAILCLAFTNLIDWSRI